MNLSEKNRKRKITQSDITSIKKKMHEDTHFVSSTSTQVKQDYLQRIIRPPPPLSLSRVLIDTSKSLFYPLQDLSRILSCTSVLSLFDVSLFFYPAPNSSQKSTIGSSSSHLINNPPTMSSLSGSQLINNLRRASQCRQPCPAIYSGLPTQPRDLVRWEIGCVKIDTDQDKKSCPFNRFEAICKFFCCGLNYIHEIIKSSRVFLTMRDVKNYECGSCVMYKMCV